MLAIECQRSSTADALAALARLSAAALCLGMGSQRLDKINDFNRHGYDLRVACRCGHVSVLNSLAVTMACAARSLPRDMSAISARLRCCQCGGREVKIGPIERDRAV
ncbi:MAG: hypothetical protein WCL10_20155 [Novosphingobium sp.]|uniref:hypothetical protein n=1 Tax=Novosphingobium sp. TaxID=1874826 RepID=UPI003016CD65